MLKKEKCEYKAKDIIIPKDLTNFVFYVTREGVYNQGLYGIFDNQELAIKTAIEIKINEPDDYHAIYVEGRLLNKQNEEPDMLLDIIKK